MKEKTMLRRLLLALAIAILHGAAIAAAQSPTKITVMTFNTYGVGKQADQPIEQIAAAIRASGADIVGLQETKLEKDPAAKEGDTAPEFGFGDSRAAELAKLLGWHVVDQQPQKPTYREAGIWANAVISKHPVRALTKNHLGALIDVNGRTVALFNVHFHDAPYQPYQLLSIPYGDYPFIKTEAEAVKFASEARGQAMTLLLDEIKANESADAMVITGDFNEPSFLDWTEGAVKTGLQPIAVTWPATKTLADIGFVDTFRAMFPDPATKPGMTWTPTTAPTAKDDHHDRIDFVLARAKALKVLSAGIVGEKAPEADIVVSPWPSDHRASVATIEF
jgi:exodeoxyribonuclease III